MAETQRTVTLGSPEAVSRGGNHAVVIAGAGPTGMMLAAELALSGVDVAVVERRAGAKPAASRAGGLHSRTLEVLDQRGVANRFISEGRTHPAVSFHIPLDITDFPTRHNYLLGLSQNHTERILAAWVDELGVRIYRGREVTGFTQDDAGVDVAVSDGSSLRAQYLVGCDGGRSLVRKAAGVAFPGWDPTTSWLIAEVRMAQAPKPGFHEDALGRHAIGTAGEDGTLGVVLVEPTIRATRERTLEELKAALIGVYGSDFGVHSPVSISSFTDMTRQAASYRDRRVLLAGDAAHVHPPLGGQGLNIGVQDAVNLGWKLAQVVKGTAPEALLDTYHAERHPVGARVLRNTMAHVAVRRNDERSKALGDTVAEFLRMDEPRKRMAGEMSGLDIRYDFGEGHPLLGRRMPDLDLATTDGTVTVYSLLHGARPALINFTAPGAMDVGSWADRLQVIDAGYTEVWELPVVGVVPAPPAVLVRADGYVAWVGEPGERGFIEALTTWFGSPG